MHPKPRLKYMRNLLYTAIILCIFSCAREVDESARSIEERILKARIQTKYLDTLHKTESGLYYMIQMKGTGAPVEKENFVYVRFSKLTLNEDYTETTEEKVAKQLGSYSNATYYGPVLWIAGVNYPTEGVDEIVLTMREGDRRRIWLPSWLSSVGFQRNTQQYTSPTIHDVEVLRVIPDIDKFQIDSLESYRDKYYPGLDSLSWGFYIKTLKEGRGDTLKIGDRIELRYIGRLLDHFIFDLNIADTAKKYNIYSASNEYKVMEGECKEDVVFEMLKDDGSYGPTVKGFSKAIFNMKHGEEAVVFFHSGLGYGAEGEGHLYMAPLVFYLKVERTNFEEEN